MGVPYLYVNLYKKYNKIKNLVINNKNIPQNKGNRKLYFDYNSLIHPCAKVITDEYNDDSNDDSNDDNDDSNYKDNIDDAIIDYVIVFTKKIIKDINVTNHEVEIVADGIAPFGKIIQQKERRFKNYFLKKENGTKTIFDSNVISPGTDFMKKLKIKLEEQFVGATIDFTKGEAEHKIIKKIKNQTNNIENFIYALDADVILLSLMTNADITLIRKTEMNTEDFELLNITILKKCLVMEFKFEKQDIDDWIFITFLLGNDFMKKIHTLQIDDLLKITEIYMNIKKRVNFQLINNDILNKEFFRELLKQINILTNKDRYKPRIKKLNKKEYIDNKWLNENNELSEPKNIWLYKTDYINYPHKNYKERYYLYYGIKQDEIKELCNDYITNLMWNYNYYKNNQEDDKYLFKELPCSPLLDELQNNIFYTENDYTQNNQQFDEEKQLQYILPKTSEKLLILDGYNCEWVWQSELLH